MTNNEINVLSLFDGMSCGRVALQRSIHNVGNYFASEVDKYAITVSNNNHDNNQLGDVCNWMEWDIDFSKIDLVLAGSPCQGFSFTGKQLGFDDPRSKLFFIFIDILNYIKSVNPNVKFLLENVQMKKEYLNVITDMLQVEPILINSSLVSAQNRKRYYWCNWEVSQPEDQGIVLKDVLENGDNSIWIKNRGEWYEREDKAMCLDANYFKGVDIHGQRSMVRSDSPVRSGIMVGRRLNEDGKREDNNKDIPLVQRIEVRGHDKTGTLTTALKDNLVCKTDTQEYRKLTPIECERLQTLPDNYTQGVSNTQRYKMLGNGWTVDVISHLLNCLKEEANDGN